MYTIGHVYDFKVKKKFTSQTEIIDEVTGLNTYLHNTQNLKLFKGQIVKCRVIGIGNNGRPIVELVDMQEFSNTTGLTADVLAQLLEKRGYTWGTEEFIKLLLTDENEESYEEQCHVWIGHLIEGNVDLRKVRGDCFDLLELSDLLDLSGNSQREFYQVRLTELIELIGYYIKAGELIAEGEQENFIDTLYNKLAVSGFIYHPDKNLNILASLFMRRPEIMRRRIAGLLKIICTRDIKIWKKEPFNSALSKLLEIYIRECIFKIDREKGEEKINLVDNLITALTVQLLITAGEKDNGVIDQRLTTARLCTIASYINQADATQLIDNAYRYIFNEDLKYLKIGIESIENAHYIIANFNPGGEIDTPSIFSNGRAMLYVDKNGISLRPAESGIATYPVLPDADLWQHMQVYQTIKPERNLLLMSGDLKRFREAWTTIENDLFSTGGRSRATASRKHHVGDKVEISFSRQDLFDRQKFMCRIEDELGGKGYITISDIVPYAVHAASLSMFLDNGARRRYPARIKDVDADGFFHFSMEEDINEETQDYYPEDYGSAEGEDIICRLGKSPHAFNGLAPAVSSEGLSVSVFAAPELRHLPAGTIVKCRYKGPSHGPTHIDCEIVEPINDFEHDFDVADAFSYLMDTFALDEPVLDQSDDTDDEMRTDRELDEDYVRQIIMCIDRMAIIDTDYIKAYNYLAFARLLCRMISWDSQAAYYKGRMDIISMLHYFDKNSEIDEAELSQLEMANAQLLGTNRPLQERFMQLQAVSYLGKPEHTHDLYALSEHNEKLYTLAQLVLAYNVVSDLEMRKEAGNIHDKIKEILNLKGFGSKLKLYGGGMESERTEFKTSFVYAPKDAAQQNQRETIMKVINAFLNTNGGTLYIGVNDAGRGVGVENDLVGEPYFSDKDKYIRDITDTVKHEFGRNVSPYVKVYFDPDNADKDVLIIEVSKYPQKVPMRNGSFFLRVNNSNEGYTREEMSTLVSGLQAAEIEAAHELLLEPHVEEEAVDEPEQPQAASEAIATSRIRQNVLESYHDDYIEPLAFLKFMLPNELAKRGNFDYDYEAPLTLTVLDDEANGYLILGYENGHIVKVPVDELLELDDDSIRKRYDGSKLIFASVAKSDNDLVLSVIKENKNNPNIVVRADKVGAFEEEQLQDNGRTACNENLVGEIIAFEVIPASMADDFSNIVNLDPTRTGHPLNKSAKMQPIIRRLKEFGIM